MAMNEQDQRLGSLWVDVGGLRMHARAAIDTAGGHGLNYSVPDQLLEIVAPFLN